MRKFLLVAQLLLSLVSASSILFDDGTVISFDEDAQAVMVLHNTSVLVVDDRINAIFPSASTNTSIPDGTEIIPAQGKIMYVFYTFSPLNHGA